MKKNVATWKSLFASLIFVACGSAAFADNMLPAPITTITGVPPTNFSAGAFATNLTYGPDGLMYVWDGQNVYQQTSINGNTFTPIGTAPFANSADAGPISFSADGSTILLGNGGGGFPPSSLPLPPPYSPPPGSTLPAPTSYNGLFFTLPVPGAAGKQATYAGTVVNNFSAIPVPVGMAIPNASTSYFVDAANANFSNSQIVLFDASTGKVTPLVTNMPGASTALTVDSSGRLYVGIGYAYGAVPTGAINTYTLSQLVNAYSTSSLLGWNDGHPFYTPGGANVTDSGNGMFIDAQGYFFTGGADGLTMISPTGVMTQYSDPGLFESFPSVAYNPLENQFALTPFGGDPEIFNISEFHAVPVPEPTSFVALVSAGLIGVIIVRRRRCGKRRGPAHSSARCGRLSIDCDAEKCA
jgi:hypothetical protein